MPTFCQQFHARFLHSNSVIGVPTPTNSCGLQEISDAFNFVSLSSCQFHCRVEWQRLFRSHDGRFGGRPPRLVPRTADVADGRRRRTVRGHCYPGASGHVVRILQRPDWELRRRLQAGVLFLANVVRSVGRRDGYGAGRGWVVIIRRMINK